jgi:hypothetical protein
MINVGWVHLGKETAWVAQALALALERHLFSSTQ